MVLIAALAGSVTVTVIVLAMTLNLNGVAGTDTQDRAALPTATPAMQARPAPTMTPTPEPQLQSEPVQSIQVKKPEFVNFTSGDRRIDRHYSEQYSFGNITVGWRPGAFPPERAEQVAEQTRQAVEEANQKLGTIYDGPVEVFLADQLYTSECFGCQGFTAADLHHVFVLQDGSVAEDEFEALLVHEVTHLIAAREIYLPHNLFYAEGLATWVMSDDLVNAGYISPLQTAAWIYRAGAMPPLETLREDSFDGRVRSRVFYDAAASFVSFIVDEYGWTAYRRLYTYDPVHTVVGKHWNALEQEWHAYLDRWADNTVNGVDGVQWWSVASQVIEGYERLYHDPEPVTAGQYADLVASRLALNRGRLDLALARLDESGMVVRTAQ